MKNIIIFFTILIVLFKTGNVLSDNNIFNVNNIEISKENSKNKDYLTDKAFRIAFDKMASRLLLDEDYKRIVGTDLEQIKKLISYYQIFNLDKNKNTKNVKFNIFFDKERMHNFFFKRNILYSDIINTEVIIFPLFKKDKKYFIYSKNYFYENWNKNSKDDIIQYSLPVENIENIQKINLNQNNIDRLNISDFFKEYESNNVVFANIDIKGSNAKIFLNTIIENKKIKKTLSISKKKEFNEKEFYDLIILEINGVIKDLIKSQNLIDVRIPSFLNVKLSLKDDKNFVELNRRIQKIDLIESFYVQQLNKDFVLVKIKYLGKIKKIIDKLSEQKINLKMINGSWKLSII